MTASQVRLAGAADEAGNVNLAWYDPREARMLIARSHDGGQSCLFYTSPSPRES